MWPVDACGTLSSWEFVQDIGNQILHSTVYRKAVKQAKKLPGRFLSVHTAEWMSGLPKDWTSPRPGVIDMASVKAEFHGSSEAGSA